MIIASVVLPSPGGPESSTWSGGAAAARGRPRAPAPSCSRTRCWPTNSSRLRGRSAASTARSSPSAAASTSAPARSTYAVLRPRRSSADSSPAHALLSVAQGGAQQPGARRAPRPSSASGATASTASSASLADQPSPTSAGVHLVAPGVAAGGGRAAAGPPAPTGRAEPVLELEDDPLRRPSGRCRGPWSASRRPRRRPRGAASSGACTASIAWASLGPTPLAVCSSSKHGLLVVVERSRRGSASPRGRPCWSAAWPARRRAAWRGCRACTCTLQADAADLDARRWSSVDGGDRAADEGDHRALLPAGRVRRRPPRRCGPGRRRARCGRWPARARRRRRPACGGASSRSSRVTIAADLGLVGPAAAGDGGLDLARACAGRPGGRAGRPPAARRRWPARCPSPCGRCAG